MFVPGLALWAEWTSAPTALVSSWDPQLFHHSAPWSVKHCNWCLSLEREEQDELSQ